MNLKYIFAIIIALLVSGCSHSGVEANTPGAVITRPDLPSGWIEVKKDNWSYGLPGDFNKTISLPLNTLAQHISNSKQINVSFTTHKMSNEILAQFVAQHIVDDTVHKDKFIIAIREKVTEPHIIAVHLLYAGDRPNAGTNALLDFFLQKDNTVYHMSCFGEALAVKKYSAMCFEILETLQIK